MKNEFNENELNEKDFDRLRELLTKARNSYLTKKQKIELGKLLKRAEGVCLNN